MTTIPLYASDFANGAFTKIAKFISVRWPLETEKPNLSRSQNILSEILGYKDFHDAKKSVEVISDVHHWSGDFVNDLSRLLFHKINSTIPPHQVDSYLSAIWKFTSSIPFGLLQFFKEEAPIISVNEECIEVVTALFHSHVLHTSVFNQGPAFSTLPYCIRYSLDKNGVKGSDIYRGSIKDLLAKTRLPNGQIALDKVAGDIFQESFKSAIDSCRDTRSALSFFTASKKLGFSSQKYIEAVTNSSNLELLEIETLKYFDIEVLNMPPSVVFIAERRSSFVGFSDSNWCLEHPYDFVDGEIVVDSEELDDEFDLKYEESMQSSYEKATRAHDSCIKIKVESGFCDFGIYYVDVDGEDSYDFYNWVLKYTDKSGEILALVCGSVFSANYSEGLTALNMMDAADSQSGSDCDSVSWTLEEYQKTLVKKYREQDLYKIPVSKLTVNTPLAIVQCFQRASNSHSQKGLGIKCLKQAILYLREYFFGSKISLSVCVEPSQYLNMHLAPDFVKKLREDSATEIIRYLKNEFKDSEEIGLENVFFPRAYAD